LQIEAHNPGGEFGPQGQGGFALVEKAVHLLFHDVGGLAHTADEEGGLFKDRGINPLIAEKGGYFRNFFLDKAPVGLLLRQDITGAANRLVSDFHVQTRGRHEY